MCRDELRSGQLVELLAEMGPAPGVAHAVFPDRRALVPAVRRLIDFLAEHTQGVEPVVIPET